MTTADAKPQRPTGRKVAEWVTLGASVALVLAVAGYLFREAMRDHPAAVPVTVRVLADEAREVDGRFVVPVEVTNRGERTLKGLTIQVTIRGGAPGGREPADVTLDYLGEKARGRVYLYLDQHPRDLGVEARAYRYELE